MWGCSRIKTLDLPKNTWDQNNKQTKETSSWNHNQSVLSTMHTVKTVKIVVFCVLFCFVLLWVFFSKQSPNQEAQCWGTVLSDLGDFVDYHELYKMKSMSRLQDQSSTLLSVHFRDLLSTSFSFPEWLVQPRAV